MATPATSTYIPSHRILHREEEQVVGVDLFHCATAAVSMCGALIGTEIVMVSPGPPSAIAAKGRGSGREEMPHDVHRCARGTVPEWPPLPDRVAGPNGR